MTRVACVFLAGGLGRRVGGGDKFLRELGGKTLLRHVIDRVQPQVFAAALNANGDPARLAAYGLPVIPDTLPDTPGPLAGVLAGMRHFSGVSAVMLSVPTDTPFLPRDLVARLLAAREADGAAVAVAASGGRVHPVVAVWPTRLADDLEAWLRTGGRRVEAFAARHGVAAAEFAAMPINPFFNVNTMLDLVEAEQMLAVDGGAAG